MRAVLYLAACGLCLVALLVPDASARSGGAPGGGRLRGPFGTGAGAVWVLEPDGRARSIVVFGHGWKVAPPSPSYPWVGQFRPWLDHLLARGNAVVFPRYQLGGDAQGPARVDSFRAGVATGLARLAGLRGLPVVAVGYSYGASLAFYFGANATRWRLPVPRGIVAVFPAGLIAGASLPALPPSVDVLIEVGDRDTSAGSGGALAFWSWLRGHPASAKRLVTVVSSAGFSADHAAPKSDSAAARRAFWAPLDAMIASARAR